ncbi:MAG: hypothetical protein WD069_00150 [Planctomycetales bacterium]
MNSSRGTALGVVGGCLLGTCLSLALGAASAPPVTVAPRYSVQNSGPMLLITDNGTNKLYIYENAIGASLLRNVVDLAKTGERELKSEANANVAVEASENP